MTIIINFNITTMIFIALIVITIKGVGERPEITPSDDEFKPVQRDVSGACKTQNTKETQTTKRKTQKTKHKNTNKVQRDVLGFCKTQNWTHCTTPNKAALLCI